ncbi:MAG: type II toxin-antitoxin system HicB family antitoxin [Microbacteriaceae bacterium]|nr:MAG: type II toxin-antitoxin system HicB family antitoxin [Microbacteriaceae bacterium]
MAEVNYDVVVTREGDTWIGDVTNLPGAHTFARRLTALDKSIREVIELVADLPTGAAADYTLTYRYVDVPSEVASAAAIGNQRRAQQDDERRLVEATAVAITQLRSAGYSGRDISYLLGISPGRTSQLSGARR